MGIESQDLGEFTRSALDVPLAHIERPEQQTRGERLRLREHRLVKVGLRLGGVVLGKQKESFIANTQYGKKSFLRDFNSTYLLHALFSCLLFFQ